MLDTVLPLVARDLARFRILQRTMRAFIRIPGTWWVVAPDRDYNLVRAAVAGDRYVVLPESRVAPELASARGVTGWYKQQLLKLAMASHVQSDFYLTLDADVIVARPVEMSDLVVQERAICHRYAGNNHRRWYRWAQRVLRLRRSGWVHGVTPVVLSCDGVRSLAAYLEPRWPRPSRWWHKTTLPLELALSQRPFANPPGSDSSRWRQMLLASVPWTEYSLYFTFLEATGQFDRFHVHSDESLCGASVWKGESLDRLQWSKADRHSPPFLVVQSNAKIPADLVAERVERLLAA